METDEQRDVAKVGEDFFVEYLELYRKLRVQWHESSRRSGLKLAQFLSNITVNSLIQRAKRDCEFFVIARQLSPTTSLYFALFL